jgi:hypothetical protein
MKGAAHSDKPGAGQGLLMLKTGQGFPWRKVTMFQLI